jgi:hypothetical protein
MSSYNKRGGEADEGRMKYRNHHAGMSSSSDESSRLAGARRRQEEQSNRMMSGTKGDDNPMLDYAVAGG